MIEIMIKMIIGILMKMLIEAVEAVEDNKYNDRS
jgi:hypothetical protein